MSQKQFTTTFEEELLKSCKQLAVECNCNVNQIFELGFKILTNSLEKEEIEEMIKRE